MPRNRTFHPLREPFRGTDRLTLEDSRTTGPFSFLNPTRARFQPTNLPEEKSQQDVAHGLTYHWRSRDNRKGRHALRIPANADKQGDVHFPGATNSPKVVLKGIIRMFTVFPFWDISWWIAVIFTLGSVVWCINGFFSFLPYAQPSSEFSTEVYYGGGITAFIGAIIFFETGSILLMFEAINENHTGCFGWALERLYSESGEKLHVLPRKDECCHHHQNTKNFVGPGAKDTPSSGKEVSQENSSEGGNSNGWQWAPTWASLHNHYFHELGFLASFAQFLGATIFGIAGFTSLPGIFNHIENDQRLLDGVYWIPQVIGGSGFIISGTLYMLETQERWWKPAYDVLGWHIGFWNLVGAIGFTLCGALGMAFGSHGAQYEASLATFWGRFA